MNSTISARIKASGGKSGRRKIEQQFEKVANNWTDVTREDKVGCQKVFKPYFEGIVQDGADSPEAKNMGQLAKTCITVHTEVLGHFLKSLDPFLEKALDPSEPVSSTAGKTVQDGVVKLTYLI